VRTGDKVTRPRAYAQIGFVKTSVAVDPGIKFSQCIRVARHGTAENEPLSQFSQDRAVIHFYFHICPVM
jgi:hypothetical protein